MANSTADELLTPSQAPQRPGRRRAPSLREQVRRVRWGREWAANAKAHAAARRERITAADAESAVRRGTITDRGLLPGAGQVDA